MPLRDDISFEANEARRLFWEKCASKAISLLPNDNDTESVYQNWHDHGKVYDYPQFASGFADCHAR